MEEGTCSYATAGCLSLPVHSSRGDAVVPSDKTRAVGSSAYFFLVTVGFLSDVVSSVTGKL